MNMNFKRKLPIPMEIKVQYPVTAELEALKAKRDELEKNAKGCVAGMGVGSAFALAIFALGAFLKKKRA